MNARCPFLVAASIAKVGAATPLTDFEVGMLKCMREGCALWVEDPYIYADGSEYGHCGLKNIQEEQP